MSANGVKQLARVSLFFSAHAGSSRGVRAAIDSGALAAFAAQHPHVLVSANVRGSREPHVVGDFVGAGPSKQIGLKNRDERGVVAVLQALAGETGRKRTRVGDSVLKRAQPEGVFSSQLL